MGTLEFIAVNKRWLIAGGLISLSSSYGQTFFISIFAGEIMREFQLTDGQWGAFYSMGTTASAIAMLYGGILSDQFRARSLASAFLILLALTCVFMALIPAVWALPFVIFALRFSGQGMLSHISVVAISRWFVAARGKALAISTLGFSVGEAFLPLVFVSCLTVVSWRQLWLVAAFGAVVVIPILFMLLKKERTPKSLAEDNSSPGMNGRHWTRKQALSHWLLWMVIPAASAPGIFSTALFFQQVHLTESKGWEHAGFVALFPVYTISTILAMFAYGIAIDRIGCSRLFAWFQIPMAASYWIIGSGTSLASVAFGFVLFGTMQGGAATLLSAFWSEFYGTKHLGSIKSLATSVMVFGSALGPGVTGYLIDAGIPFHRQMGFYVIYILAVCLLTHMAMRWAKPSLLVNAAA